MKIDLTGKNILVTGASRGIGRALALGLAQSGATVAIHYNRNRAAAQSLANEIEGNTIIIQADLSNPSEVQRLFESVIQQFGQLDVLVNNAGVAFSSALEASTEQWLQDLQQTLNVNLIASALLCKLAIPHFIKNKGGIIINISSRAAFRGDTADYMAYAASKGGLVALTRSIARAYGKQNIKAFDIAPGFTKTDMAQDFIDLYGEDYVKDDIALNELTEPKHIAPLVVLLASGLADHLTGTTIDVNAGSYVH